MACSYRVILFGQEEEKPFLEGNEAEALAKAALIFTSIGFITVITRMHTIIN